MGAAVSPLIAREKIHEGRGYSREGVQKGGNTRGSDRGRERGRELIQDTAVRVQCGLPPTHTVAMSQCPNGDPALILRAFLARGVIAVAGLINEVQVRRRHGIAVGLGLTGGADSIGRQHSGEMLTGVLVVCRCRV